MRIAQEALTFDDVLLVPAHSRVMPKEVSLVTRLTREISLNIPLISAAMDTVTEARLAISMAQEGGIGIIHKNMTGEQQAAQVRQVKKFESGVINDPVTVGPRTSIREVLELTRAHNISGVPVVNGELSCKTGEVGIPYIINADICDYGNGLCQIISSIGGGFVDM